MRRRLTSFPLDGGRWFAGNIVNYPRYSIDLIGNSHRNTLKEFVRKAGPARRHEVHGFHCPQGHNIFVTTLVAGDAHGLYRQEHSKRLTDLVIQAFLIQFLDENMIRTGQQVDEFFTDFPQHSYTQPRRGSGDAFTAEPCAR